MWLLELDPSTSGRDAMRHDVDETERTVQPQNQSFLKPLVLHCAAKRPPNVGKALAREPYGNCPLRVKPHSLCNHDATGSWPEEADVSQWAIILGFGKGLQMCVRFHCESQHPVGVMAPECRIRRSALGYCKSVVDIANVRPKFSQCRKVGKRHFQPFALRRDVQVIPDEDNAPCAPVPSAQTCTDTTDRP